MTVSAELLGVLIAVLAVGAAVVGLALAGIRGLRADMRDQRAEFLGRLDAMGQQFNGQLQALGQQFNGQLQALEQKIDGQLQALEQKNDARFQALDMRMRALEHGQAKLEGLLEGLREAIVARGAA